VETPTLRHQAWPLSRYTKTINNVRARSNGGPGAQGRARASARAKGSPGGDVDCSDEHFGHSSGSFGTMPALFGQSPP
jgi:hypothetical protein